MLNRFWAILLILTCLTAQALPVSSAVPAAKPESCSCAGCCQCPTQPNPCGCAPAPARASWTGITAQAVVVKRTARTLKKRAPASVRTAFYTPFLTAPAVPSQLRPSVPDLRYGQIPLFREQCRFLI